MTEASRSLHEAAEALRPETADRHRAIASLMEELEAVDWYQQRVDAAGDDELRAVLAHNRDEEIEHAAMVLEWLRRHDPTFAKMLRAYLFTVADITRIEKTGEGRADDPSLDDSLGIGDLKGDEPL